MNKNPKNSASLAKDARSKDALYPVAEASDQDAFFSCFCVFLFKNVLRI